jgi:rare lipoprotein A
VRNIDSRSGFLLNPLPPPRQWATWIIAVFILTFVGGCGTILKQDKRGKTGTSTLFGIGLKKGGGYYLDDGPGDNPPADLASIPDAVPRDEPLRQANMRPYVALGKSYAPMTVLESYRERGIASWYGRRYHGQRTASGEVYDMYGMTAAHTTLPLPSYARVTNIRNGKSIVVRVNDRGPFLSDRIIDLSYTAAYKLDVLGGGSAWVEVETILPGSGPAMRVASAPAFAPKTAASFATAGPPAPVPASAVAGEKTDAPAAAGQQEEAAGPGLFEVAYSPKESGASGSTAALATADARGIYLQLGAFSAYDNADNFLARMRSELPSIDALGIVPQDGLFKVHAGPYPDQVVARQAAAKIARSLSIKPMLLVR